MFFLTSTSKRSRPSTPSAHFSSTLQSNSQDPQDPHANRLAWNRHAQKQDTPLSKLADSLQIDKPRKTFESGFSASGCKAAEKKVNMSLGHVDRPSPAQKTAQLKHNKQPKVIIYKSSANTRKRDSLQTDKRDSSSLDLASQDEMRQRKCFIKDKLNPQNVDACIELGYLPKTMNVNSKKLVFNLNNNFLMHAKPDAPGPAGPPSSSLHRRIEFSKTIFKGKRPKGPAAPAPLGSSVPDCFKLGDLSLCIEPSSLQETSRSMAEINRKIDGYFQILNSKDWAPHNRE